MWCIVIGQLIVYTVYHNEPHAMYVCLIAVCINLIVVIVC